MRRSVYSDGSVFGRKIRIIRAEKNLEFEAEVPHDYLRTHDSLKEHNPLLQVPIFYDSGRVIWGSDLILHYLFSTYPETPSNALPQLSPALARPDMYWDDMLTLTTIDSMADAIVNCRRMIAGGPAFKNTFMERQIGRVPLAGTAVLARRVLARDVFGDGHQSVVPADLWRNQKDIRSPGRTLA